MPQNPELDLSRRVASISLERLIEGAGIGLSRSGKDLKGCCPFHGDSGASLLVSPSANQFRCAACGAEGGPLEWVMRSRGISRRHAAELLKADHVLPPEPLKEVAKSSQRLLPAPMEFSADDPTLLRQVIDYYAETLKQSGEALAYLKARGIDHPEAIERFKLGHANRTLGLRLPIKQLKAGAEIRGRLVGLGLYRESGHEHFNGSLVIPILGPEGEVLQVYGRKLLDNLRKGTERHLYLPGPLKGVWNVDALQESKEIILCKSLIDALTFWCAGYRNVTAAYGVNGFTEDHLEAMQGHGTQRVLVAYDRDEEGDGAARGLSERLTAKGIGCYRIVFPRGLDASALVLKTGTAGRSLGQVIRAAEWMGSGRAPQRVIMQPVNGPESSPSISAGAVPTAKAIPIPESVAVSKPMALPLRAPVIAPGIPVPQLPPQSQPSPQPSSQLCSQPLPASPIPSPPGDDLAHEVQGQDLLLRLEDRSYRIRGWQKALNPEFMKVNLMVSRHERFHVDSLDLYQAKARAAFVRQGSLEVGLSEDALKSDLGKVLRKVEALQADQLTEALRKKDPRPTLTQAEHAEAVALLKSPNLMRRVLHDFEALGVVGEESNKLTGYLAAVSRLLDRPLALLIQSASAAGKSSLMDAVLDFIPEEDLVRYSAMTGQSLFYMGDRRLSHKVLSIAEEEGARHASYALKLLQSEGRVTMASTGKDPNTGMLVTHDYSVEGPVMLFLTTTAIDLDEELLNRCLVLTVDESREQTRAIHSRQRSRETLEGLLARRERERIITLHRNAQRLLQPLAVVNPYADRLSFRDDQTRSRRDHVKYLTLIRAIALLHQFQREVKTLTEGDEPLHYIEVMPSDIELANELAQEVLGRSLDELLPQTRKLVKLMREWVQGECERLTIGQADFRFTRKQLREALGWGDTQLKVHLARLVELELLLAHRGSQGKRYAYELLYQGEDAEGRAKLLGLIACDKLTDTATPSRGREPHFTPHGRGMVGGQSGQGPRNGDGLQATPTGDSRGREGLEVTGSIPASPFIPSYPQPFDHSGEGL